MLTPTGAKAHHGFVRRVLILSLASLVVSSIGGSTVAASATARTPSFSCGSIAVLSSRAGRTHDVALSPRARAQVTRVIEPGSARFARSLAGRRFYVARGRTPFTTCALTVSANDSAAFSCQSNASFKCMALVQSMGAQAGAETVLIIAGDGVTTINGRTVSRNTVAYVGSAPITLRIKARGKTILLPLTGQSSAPCE